MNGDMSLPFLYLLGIIDAFENLWGADSPLQNTSTFGHHFGAKYQGPASSIIPTLDTLWVHGPWVKYISLMAIWMGKV